MKKTLLLFLLLWGSLHLCAQNDYYWSSGKKIRLTTDSTAVIIKARSSTELKNAATRFRSLARPGTSVNSTDSLHLTVRYSGKAVLSEVLKSLPADAVKAGDAVYGQVSARSPFLLTGSILYQLNDDKTPEDVRKFLSNEGEIKQYVDQYNTVHLTPARLDRVLPLANKLYESGLVKWCHPDFYSDFKPSTNDPLFGNQFYLKNTGQNGGTYGIDINVEQAWNVSGATNIIRVAVIDDGVEAHEDLGTRVVAGYSAGGIGTGAPASATAGHGEACAGIIGATRENSLGIAGICSNCQIVPVNIFNGPGNAAASAGEIANSINWAWTATQGNADVLSCSWGGGLPSDAITLAITNARTLGRANRGAVVVFAAGNFANGSTSSVAYPANVAGVISVGAINKNGNRWYYSPNSPSLVAPSGDVNLAGDIYTIDRTGNNGYNAGNYMTNFGGTSAACPQVAGVAALILSVSPHLTEAQVKSAILNNATNMNNTVNFGVGRLNADAAIRASLPAIAGPNSFCTSSAVFNITNAPPGAVIVWSNSNSSTASITPSGTQVTVNRITTGYTTLSATVNGTPVVSKNLTLGSNAAITAEQSGSCYDGKMTWNLTATPSSTPATNWQWTVDDPGSGTWYISNPNSPYTSVTVQGGGYVSVSFTDACGLTSLYSGALVYSPCPTGMMSGLTAYPNPANNQLNIQYTGAVNASSKTATGGGFEAKLYNDRGTLLRASKGKTAGDTIIFDTANIPNGTYYLHIFQGGQKTEKQIVIKH